MPVTKGDAFKACNLNISNFQWNKLKQVTEDGSTYSFVPSDTSVLEYGLLFNLKDTISPMRLAGRVLVIKQNKNEKITDVLMVTAIPDIEMPRDSTSFSGLVVLSKLNGEVIGSVYFKSKDNIFPVVVLSSEIVGSSKADFWLKRKIISKKNLTKATGDGDNDGENDPTILTPIVISANAVNISWPNWFQALFNKYNLNFCITFEDMGGSSTGPNFPSTLSSNQAVVELYVTGSGSVSGAGLYTKGDVVTLRAIPDNYVVFAGWKDITRENASFVSHELRYSFTINESRRFNAVFLNSASNCAELYNTVQDSLLLKYIDTLRAKSLRNSSIEHGDLVRSDRTLYQKNGADEKASYTLENNVKYIESFHTHPNGSGFISAGDLIALRNLLNKNAIYNLSTFVYGVVANNRTMIIQIEDVNKFENFVGLTELLQKKFKRNYEILVEESTDGGADSDGAIYRLTRFLDNSGLRIYSDFRYENDDHTMVSNWNKITFTNGVYNKSNCLE